MVGVVVFVVTVFIIFFLYFLHERLMCPNSPQLKHRTDSVERKTL